MKNYESKHAATLSTRGFYTILALCGLIIAASAWVIFSTMSGNETKTDTGVSTPIIAPTETLPDLTSDTPVSAEDTEPSAPTSAPVETPVETPAAAPAQTVAAPVYVRPTSGAIITPFSGDELLFQPTFGDWRVHTGTDFAAEAGEPVLALTNGTVTDVTDDALYGKTVTISHDADLTTSYSGLDVIRVEAGQSVDAGETLGTCAETIPAESAQGAHVHVTAQRAGAAVDVTELLGEDAGE